LVPIVPVMNTVTLAVTGVVLTVNVAVVVPAGTVTDPGTVTLALLDASVTTSPLGPAGASKVTVPVVELPPITAPGDRVIVEIPASVIVRLAVCVLLARLAEIEATVVPDTATVVIVKVVDVAPPAIVTVPGRVALVEFEVRLMVTPPVGAALVRVTVPVEVPPPRTEFGDKVTDAMDGGLTVKVAVLVDPAVEAEIVTDVAVDTPLVVIGKVAEDEP